MMFIVVNVARSELKFGCKLCDPKVKLLVIWLFCIYQVCKHNWEKFLLNLGVTDERDDWGE